MKKILLAVTAILSFGMLANAQAPVGDFETWDPTPAPSASHDPRGWVSFNAVTLAGMPQTVFQETTAPYAGTTSVKVVTDVLPASVMIPNPFNPTQDLDTVGLLAIGKFASIFPPTLKYGYTYAWRPATLSFACKYTPVSGDTAFVLAYLTHWNGTSRDTVAAGTYKTGATSTAYAVQNLNLTYDPAFNAVMPDTEQIFVSSSVFMHDGAKKGSAFYMDNWAWSGYVSTNDINGTAGIVSVFPNPATTDVQLKSTVDAGDVRIYDVTGREIGFYTLENNAVKINTDNYPTGLYFFQLRDKNKHLIHTGKFEVNK